MWRPRCAKHRSGPVPVHFALGCPLAMRSAFHLASGRRACHPVQAPRMVVSRQPCMQPVEARVAVSVSCGWSAAFNSVAVHADTHAQQHVLEHAYSGAGMQLSAHVSMTYLLSAECCTDPFHTIWAEEGAILPHHCH
jgi:hypothetical protein